MTNNTTTKENQMIEKLTVALIIGSGILGVIMSAITCAWILAKTL